MLQKMKQFGIVGFFVASVFVLQSCLVGLNPIGQVTVGGRDREVGGNIRRSFRSRIPYWQATS